MKENKIRKFIMMMADWMVADWTVSMYFKNRCVKHAHSSQTFFKIMHNYKDMFIN